MKQFGRAISTEAEAYIDSRVWKDLQRVQPGIKTGIIDGRFIEKHHNV